MKQNEQEYLVEKIRNQYAQEASVLEDLKRLDAKVKALTNVFVYVFGGLG